MHFTTCGSETDCKRRVILARDARPKSLWVEKLEIQMLHVVRHETRRGRPLSRMQWDTSRCSHIAWVAKTPLTLRP